MVNRRFAFSAFGALILGLSLTGSTHGSTALHTNTLTFGGPVRLPGVTLPAGTYLFERVELTNPDVIVVRSHDRSKKYFLGYTRRIERPVGLRADRLVTLGEAARGDIPAVEAWYPLGERMGHAFIYGSR